MCAVGILLALIDRGNTGRGQVVNTDMVCVIHQHSFFVFIIDRCRAHVTSHLSPSFMTILRKICQGGRMFWVGVRPFTMFTLAKMGAGCQSDA